MTQVQHLVLHRGDSLTVQAFLRDEQEQPINDPGAVYTLQARPTPTSDELIIDVSAAQHAPGEGRCVIDPIHTESFTYDRTLHYDVQVTESDGTATTLQAGRIAVLVDVAR